MKTSQVLFYRSSLLAMFVLMMISHALIGQSNCSQINSTCQAINCTAGFYQTIDSDGKLVRYEYDGFSLGFTQVSVFGFTVNATAFNIEDNYLYTIDNTNNRLIQFSTDGTWTNLGFINLPTNVVVGSFDNDGNYYVCAINGNNAFRIDVNTLQVTTVPFSGGAFRAADWAYLECQDKFYGVGNDNRMYSFDPNNGAITVTNLTGDLAANGHHGGAFTDINGALYVSNNPSGNIFSINVTTGVSTILLGGPSAGTNDGTSCPCSTPPFPTLFPQDDEVCVDEDGAVVEIFLNDSYSFADLDYNSFTIVEPATNGNVFYTPQTQSIFYLSNDPTMADSFVYEICLDIDLIFCEQATVRFFPSASTVFNETVCDGDDFVLDGFPFTETGEYELFYTAANGCDSVVTLNLEVIGAEPTLFEEQICADTGFVFNEVNYMETGEYEFNYISSSGCDSMVVLKLTVNDVYADTIVQEVCEGVEYVFDGVPYTESGVYTVPYTSVLGCDSIYTIDLTVNQNVSETIEGSLCGGDSLVVNGVTYSESGTYTQDLFTVTGCDSMLTLIVNVADNVEATTTENICEGTILDFPDGTELSEAGDYEILLQAANGCDSTLRLTLNVLQDSEEELNGVICADETYILPDGTTFDTTGVYELSYTAANGCDSMLILDLLVNEIYEEDIEAFICQGETYPVGGDSFTETGEYAVELQTASGCDSIINLTLTVGREYEINMEAEVCAGDPYTFGSEMLTSTGVYEQYLLTESGCDSIIVLDFQVLENKENEIAVSICQGTDYDFGTTSYSEAGEYSANFTAANGCDSMVTLILSIAPNFTIDIEESICNGDTLFFRGEEYTDSGEFEFDIEGIDGCDSIINLSVQRFDSEEEFISASICDDIDFESGGVTYTEPGLYEQRYLTSNGCDSVVMIDLEVNPTYEIMLADTICDGETSAVGTEVFTVGGIYEVNFTSVTGCDSVVILDLTAYQNKTINLSREICSGEQEAIGSETYNTTGIHETRFVSSEGCDSTVVLDLTVHPNYEFFEEAEICQNDTYSFAGQSFSETGVFEVPLQTVNGCDSMMVLDLFVNQSQTTNLEQTICFGTTYDFGTEELSEEGEYRQDLLSESGCDSTVILNLILADRFETNLEVDICEGEEVPVGSELFTETGSYEVPLVASNGCDSLVRLELVKFTPDEVELTESICQGDTYVFGMDALEVGGRYTLDLTNVNGCDSTVNLDLAVLEIYEFQFDREICDGDSYGVGTSLYEATGVYLDTFATVEGCDSVIITNLLVREHTMSQVQEFTCFDDQVGQETLMLSNSFGCDSTVVITTSLSPPSECFVVVEVAGMTIPCMDELGSLVYEILIGTPPFTINWTGPQNGSVTQNNLGSFTIENLLPGSYNIEVVDANGNSTDGGSEILEFDVPDVIAEVPLNSSGFNINCFGGADGSASVNAIGGTAPYDYLWSNGATTDEVQNLSAGIYSVTLIDANNCVDTTIVEIRQPDPLALASDPIDLTCDDPQSGVVTIDSEGGVPPYMYSLNGSESQIENIFSELAEGTYSSLVTDANGCTTEVEFSLFMPTAVEVELGDDIDIKLGDLVQIQALVNLGPQDINTILWSENLNTDCDDCLVQTFMPSESGTYTIYVLDENGCETTDDIVINVDTDQTIYAPNAFSPNGDGINDAFTLYSDSRFSPIISELHIYDRWGNEVFVNYDFPPNAEVFGWNGDFRGEPHNPGVFVYHATVEYIDGSTEFLKGDITLMK